MKRLKLDQLFDSLLPFFATLAALAIGGVMLVLMGANPMQGYAALLDGAFGSTNALADTLVKATLSFSLAWASASPFAVGSSILVAKAR